MAAAVPSDTADVLASVQTAWLFTRGSESIRIVRAAAGEGAMHLLVQGPGETTDRREFSDVLDCMSYQADLERRLVSQGYALERFTSDRRSGRGSGWLGGRDRRRLPHLFL
jgi:hypothetical protein